MWGPPFTVVVITLALFGETAFFAHHAGAQNNPARPLQYPTMPGEANGSECFIGGSLWDLRATGLPLGNSSASQGQGSPVNPTEMPNRDPACVVRRMSQRPYRTLFEKVFGPRAFDIHWPANVDALCSLPNDNPQTRIGSEDPGPNGTPSIVPLATADRA